MLHYKRAYLDSTATLKSNCNPCQCLIACHGSIFLCIHFTLLKQLFKAKRVHPALSLRPDISKGDVSGTSKSLWSVSDFAFANDYEKNSCELFSEWKPRKQKTCLLYFARLARRSSFWNVYICTIIEKSSTYLLYLTCAKRFLTLLFLE